VLVVIDTNVLVSALRSRRGASFRLLSEVGSGRFEIALSVPLAFEYEEALLGYAASFPGMGQADIDAILDFVYSAARQQRVFYLWRPCLPDPDDDMVLELAVAASAQAIITYNVRDFRGAERFNVAVWRPVELLRIVGVVA
jgi:putative PIN family toxin of toxin-antitoxin system